MLVYVVILAAFFGAIGQYLDKHLANLGISKKDYFYYMCLTMIPFSIIMIIIELKTGQFKFQFGIIPLILLLIAMYLRYKKQSTIVGCLKYLNPYESSAYLSSSIFIAYIIDVLLKVEDLTLISIVSIIFTIIGVFMVSNSKIKIKNLRKDLFVRIISSLLMSYITHFILKYWSNAIFLLILNSLLVIIFSKDYKFNYHIKNINIIKWAFVQQIFGFMALYLSNYLATNSVILSSHVRPVSMVFVLLISMLSKKRSNKPTLRQIFGVLLIVISIYCII